MEAGFVFTGGLPLHSGCADSSSAGQKLLARTFGVGFRALGLGGLGGLGFIGLPFRGSSDFLHDTGTFDLGK